MKTELVEKLCLTRNRSATTEMSIERNYLLYVNIFIWDVIKMISHAIILRRFLHIQMIESHREYSFSKWNTTRLEILKNTKNIRMIS